VDVAALRRGIREMERRAGEGPAAAEELQRLLALTKHEAAARPEAAAVLAEAAAAEAAAAAAEAEAEAGAGAAAAWRGPSEPRMARDSSVASLAEEGGDTQLAEEGAAPAAAQPAAARPAAAEPGTKPAEWRQSDALNRAGRIANEEHDPAP